MTRDVDLAVLTGFGRELEVAQAVLRAFKPRRPDALEFALRYRVVLAVIDGIGIDLSLAALPFEEAMIRRATAHVYAPGAVLRTCSAEDLVILKAFAARPQDWLDIDRILDRSRDLDWSLIEPTIQMLADLKEDTDITSRLAQCRVAAQRRRRSSN